MAQPKTAPSSSASAADSVSHQSFAGRITSAGAEARREAVLARNAHRGDVFGDRARRLERRGDGDADALHPRLGVLFGGVGATGGREEAGRQRATTGNLARLEVVQDRLRALGANIETRANIDRTRRKRRTRARERAGGRAASVESRAVGGRA